MKVRDILFKDNVLIFAILFSAVWHIFWLSAFTVIVVPKVEKGVKFSNVSFLGPILEKNALNVNVNPSERTTLEKKYFDSIKTQAPLTREGVTHDYYVLPAFDMGLSYGSDEEFIAMTIGRIDTYKIEPSRDVE